MTQNVQGELMALREEVARLKSEMTEIGRQDAGAIGSLSQQVFALQRLVDELQELRISGPHSYVLPPKIFNGECRLAGKIISTTLNSYPAQRYVRCVLSTQTATEETGPPPDPWADNEVWREKVEISGTWYIDRVGG